MIKSYRSRSFRVKFSTSLQSCSVSTSTFSPLSRQTSLFFTKSLRSHAKFSPSTDPKASRIVAPLLKCCIPTCSSKVDFPLSICPKAKRVLGLSNVGVSLPLLQIIFIVPLLLVLLFCLT